MNRAMFKSVVNLLILSLAASPSCSIKDKPETISGDAAVAPVASAIQGAFSEAERDALLAPIALYPDALLAQILPYEEHWKRKLWRADRDRRRPGVYRSDEF